ncbi:hypothetical protein [Flindersiella endophytica]
MKSDPNPRLGRLGEVQRLSRRATVQLLEAPRRGPAWFAHQEWQRGAVGMPGRGPVIGERVRGSRVAA